MKDLLTDSENKDDDYDLLDEPSNFKNLFLIAFAFIILLAFGFVFYYFVLQSDEPTKRNPTSQADVPLLLPSGVLKEIPEDAGGVKIPNQDQQVFEVIENPTQPETAVPEEEPKEESEKEPKEEIEPTPEPTPTPEPAPETEDTNLLPLPEEPQLETEPTQNVEPEPSPEPSPEPAPEAEPAPEPAPEAEVEPEPSTDGDKKLRIEFLENNVEQPEASTDGDKKLRIEFLESDVEQPEPAPETEAEAEPEPEPEPETQAPTIGYIAQLSALDNANSAEIFRNSMLTEFPSLLTEDNLLVKEGLLTDGNAIFRIQTTPLELDEARTLCSALKEQGRECFIKQAP